MTDEKLPLSTPLTVLHADVPPVPLGFMVYEYLGGEVYKAKAGVSDPKSLDDFNMNVPLKNREDLKEGDKIAVRGFFGWGLFTVKVDPSEKGLKLKLYGDSQSNIAILLFGEDDRQCWTSCGEVNKRCLDKLQLMPQEA